jgi:hypothetical protein
MQLCFMPKKIEKRCNNLSTRFTHSSSAPPPPPHCVRADYYQSWLGGCPHRLITRCHLISLSSRVLNLWMSIVDVPLENHNVLTTALAPCTVLHTMANPAFSICLRPLALIVSRQHSSASVECVGLSLEASGSGKVGSGKMDPWTTPFIM